MRIVGRRIVRMMRRTRQGCDIDKDERSAPRWPKRAPRGAQEDSKKDEDSWQEDSKKDEKDSSGVRY